MRILTVDIGNTSALFARMEKGRVKTRFRLPTSHLLKSRGHLKLSGVLLKNVDAAVVGSVVPKASGRLCAALRSKKIRVYQIGKDLKVPIRNLYRRPRQVGTDRLLNAIAAHRKYRKPCIIVDFGTAITFDAVSRRGEYLGGVIAPGIEISLEALFHRTALLPRIRLVRPKGILGRDTVESMRAGCAYGIGGLCDRVVSLLKKKLGTETRVLATGGYAPFMKRYCRSFRVIDPDLTLKGIWITFQKTP